MSRIIGCISLLFFLPGLAYAQLSPQFDASRMTYLFAPVERILSIRRQGEVKLDELQEALQEACGALGSLVDDEEFQRVVEYYSERQYDSAILPDIKRIYQDFQVFLEFLTLERDQLIKYLSDEAADQILAHLLASRQQARNFQIDHQAVLSSLRSTWDSTCTAAEELAGSLAYADLIEMVGRVTLAMVGATAIGVDTALVANQATVAFGVASIIGGTFLLWLADQ